MGHTEADVVDVATSHRGIPLQSQAVTLETAHDHAWRRIGRSSRDAVYRCDVCAVEYPAL